MELSELEKLSTEELEGLLLQRKKDISQHKVMQLGLKVTLNSAYGFLGNEYSRMYDVRMAEAITISGQLSIQWIRRKLNEFLNSYLGMTDHDFVIAGDTDSIYLSLAPFVEKVTKGRGVPKEKIVKMLDRFCEEVMQPQIDKGYQELADYMNAYDQKMIMAREVIADRGLWRAKKNYALNVHNSEGVAYTEPKLKIMGIESVKSSTPEICRDAIKEVIRLILTSDEQTVQNYIKEFRAAFMKADTNDIASPSGFSDITKWNCPPPGFKKDTPYHVKAAMIYNRLLNKYELRGRYREMRDGDKGKILHLKKGNPAHNKYIAYPDILPPELGLDNYVDRVLQFKKKFLAPSESLLELAGWNSKKRAKLF